MGSYSNGPPVDLTPSSPHIWAVPSHIDSGLGHLSWLMDSLLNVTQAEAGSKLAS